MIKGKVPGGYRTLRTTDYWGKTPPLKRGVALLSEKASHGVYNMFHRASNYMHAYFRRVVLLTLVLKQNVIYSRAILQRKPDT